MASYQEPDFLPWDGRRVPMTFLAGYLGAGKTTLINQLLAVADQPVAVLVNDVGEINIDAALIRSRHGDTIELTDGCVCCSLSEGFAVAIDSLRERPEPPDHVVVELSGVADPSRVVPWAHSAGFKLDGVVTVVDVDQFDERMTDALSAATMTTQISNADLLVMSKLDLVAPLRADEVENSLQGLAPRASIIRADNATVAALLNLGGRRPGGTTAVPEPTLFDQHETTVVELADPIDRIDLEKLLDGFGPEVVRAKGIARQSDGGNLLVQVVGKRRSITDLPASESEQPTDLVVISLPST